MAYRVVDPSILLTAKYGVRQGLFLYKKTQGKHIYKTFG